MIDTLEINSLNLGGNTDYPILEARGFGSPNVEIAKYSISGRHGIEIPNALWRERRLRLIIGMKAATQSDYASLRENLIKAFGLPRTGNSILYITTTDGKNLQLTVQLSNPIEADFEKGRLTSGEARIELISTTPYIYGQTLNDNDLYLPIPGGFTIPTEIPLSLASSGGTVTLINAGNGVAWPTLTIYGPVTDPHVRNNTLEKQFTVDYTLSDSDYIDIDLQEETVVLNGTTNLLGNTSGYFWWLEPGNNIISYTSETYDANSYVKIKHRDSYVGI